ncbi:GntR family transcriptional regulator [Microbacterium sp. GXF7504]
MMAQVTPRRMTDEVTRILHDRIVRGELPPGTKLDLVTLAEELGVSRTPLREAVLRLEASGLVVRQPYRGAVVAGVDVQRLEEVTALRIDLEGRAALLAVPRLADATIDAMVEVLDDIEAKQHDDDFSPVGFNELNATFHDLLYAAAGAPQLLRLINTLSAEADRIRLHFDLRSPLAEQFHRDIVEACRRRDADAAALATRQHILESFFAMRGGDRDPGDGILAQVLRDFSLR